MGSMKIRPRSEKDRKREQYYRIMVDGAGPRKINGVPSISAAVIALSPAPNTSCLHHAVEVFTDGPLSSVVAEMRAMEKGLEVAVAIKKENPEAGVILFSDAQWCVNVANGHIFPNNATHLHDIAHRIVFLKNLSGCKVSWVSRDYNGLADSLSKSIFR